MVRDGLVMVWLMPLRFYYCPHRFPWEINTLKYIGHGLWWVDDGLGLAKLLVAVVACSKASNLL